MASIQGDDVPPADTTRGKRRGSIGHSLFVVPYQLAPVVTEGNDGKAQSGWPGTGFETTTSRMAIQSAITIVPRNLCFLPLKDGTENDRTSNKSLKQLSLKSPSPVHLGIGSYNNRKK